MSMFGSQFERMLIEARDRQRMADFYAEPPSPIPGMQGGGGYSPPGQSFAPSGGYGQQAMGLLGTPPAPTPQARPQMPMGLLAANQPPPQQQMVPGFFGSSFQMPPQASAGGFPANGFMGSRFRGK